MNWESIGVIGGLLCNVIMVVIVLSNRSEKRVVSISPDATSHAEFTQHVQTNREAHKALHFKIDAVRDGTRAEFDERFLEIARAGEASRDKLHERINEVLTAVSRLEGRRQP